MNPIWFSPYFIQKLTQKYSPNGLYEKSAHAGSAAACRALTKKPPAGRVSFLQAFISVYCIALSDSPSF
jgi:hypothetical protein